jgi:dipeptidyl aminopeptidase/acylaminoacyl peptidase
MLTSKIGARSAEDLAAALFLALAILLFGSYPVQAQDEDTNEITFVRLANGAPGGEGVYIINADGSGERPLFLFDDLGLPYDVSKGGYRCPVWSPDGTQMAFNGTEGETNYLAVVNVDDGGVRRVYQVQHDTQTFRNIYFPAWTPDASRLSFGFTEAERNTGVVLANGIRSVSLEDGEVVTVRDDIDLTEGGSSPRIIGGPVPNYTPFSHSWSPDGSQLALASYNWRTYLLDGNGAYLRELPSQWANGDVEWSPDGSMLAVSLYRLTLIHSSDGTERELVPIGETLNGSTVESLAWSLDGGEIAYSTMWIDISSGAFTTAFSLSVVDVETGEIRELVRTPSFTGSDYPYNISCVDWRPANQN